MSLLAVPVAFLFPCPDGVGPFEGYLPPPVPDVVAFLVPFIIIGYSIKIKELLFKI